MMRVLRIPNYGVYVGDERGGKHHSPHAHIKHRGRRIASVHILSLEVFKQIAPVPAEVMQLMLDNQETLIAAWERLNA